MTKGNQRNKHSYNRTPGNTSPHETIRILTEGEVTEPEYFKAPCDSYGISRGLVDEALKERSKNNKPASRDSEARVTFWWVVVDAESSSEKARSQNIEEALAHAKGKISVVVDSPSIEYWFLLHFRYTAKDYDSADDVIKDLKREIPDYSKAKGRTDWGRLISSGRTEKAISRAKRVENERQANDTARPSADCYKLVERIKSDANN